MIFVGKPNLLGKITRNALERWLWGGRCTYLIKDERLLTTIVRRRDLGVELRESELSYDCV